MGILPRMTDTASKWRALVQRLEPNQPANHELYVKPEHSPAKQVVSDLLAVPQSFPKTLLVGARGGGKSTELREIAYRLDQNGVQVVTVDLDQSGVSASNVSASDLLYVSALGLLRIVERSATKEAQALFKELVTAYSGKPGDDLGTLEEALKGLAEFASGAAKVAAAVGTFAGAIPVAAGAAAVGATSIGLRLTQRGPGGAEVIAESSSAGRALQAVCERIVHRVRGERRAPLCVVIDGLEKINGEAGERFRQVFEQTRLIADTPWASVIAAPPCTLTETNSADSRGFTTLPVWGFDPNPSDALRQLLVRRFQAAELDPTRCVDDALLDRIASESGGLPRHAIAVLRRAVLALISEGADTLAPRHVDAGLDELGQALARGLDDEHFATLKRVVQTGKLPGKGGKAATLFADGRILARPPTQGSRAPRFVVHPLLLADVNAFAPEDE